MHWEITGQFSWRKNVKSKNSLQRYNYKCNIHFLFLRMVESNGSHIARDIKVLLFSIIIMQENNHIYFFYFKKFMHPFLRINFIKFRNTCNTITISWTYEVRYMLLCIQNISEWIILYMYECNMHVLQCVFHILARKIVGTR